MTTQAESIPNNLISPRVSVCCSTYNHQKYIRQALESIFAQKTDFPFEVIVHDDASTDETASIIREFEEQYPNMRAIYQVKNQFSQGIGSVNVAFTLPLVQGEYVIINEGDDYFIDPLKLQKQVDFLDAHPECTLCFHQVRLFYEDDPRPDSLYPPKEALEEKQILTLEDLLKVNFIQTNSCMYRWAFKGEIIKEVFPKDILPGDYFLHLLHAMRGSIGFIDGVMAAYRRHSESLWAAQVEKDFSHFYLENGRKIYNFFSAVENMVGDLASIIHNAQTTDTLQILIREYIKKERINDIQYIAETTKNISEIIQIIATIAIESNQNFHQTTEKLAHANEHIASISADLAQTTEKLAHANEHSANISADLAQTTEKLAHADEYIANISADLAQTTEKLAYANEHIANISADLAQTTEKVAHANEHIANISADLAQTTEKLTHADEHIANISADLAQTTRKLTHANEHIANISAELAQTTEKLTHADEHIANISAELIKTASSLHYILHSWSWRMLKPLRVCAQYGYLMYKHLHTFLLRTSIFLCLLPASFFCGDKEWLRKVLSGKKNFAKIIENPTAVSQQVEGRNPLIRSFVNAPLRVAVSLRQTRSFKQTLRRILSALEGAPKQVDKHNEHATSSAQDSLIDHDSLKIHDYVKAIASRACQEVPPDFVPITQEQACFDNITIKLIAFYLPQFHAFPLNDEWYGKGFTEWTNVTKAIPLYTDHYQPQLPIDMGFYDLSDINVMKRQVELAKLYGVHGFCFHYYWFSGTRIMEMPIFNWLEHQEVDFPFCLNWANENWSKLWDGGDKEVRYKQELLDDDDEKFFMDILPFFNDRRYIKVDNKPVLVIYRPHLFEKDRCRTFLDKQRELAKAHGFEGLLLISVNSHGFQDDPKEWGLDATVEFPPHCLLEHGLQGRPLDMYIDPNFDGHVWDGKEYIESKKYLYDVNYKLFKGVCPSWDNTPRKAYSNGSVIDCITPEFYKQWLNGCIEYTKAHHDEKEQFVFINAWNEWAEGAHIEPDSRYGYAYLQATKDALLKKTV